MWYACQVQTAKTDRAMVSKYPFPSVVPIIDGLGIGGRKDPV